MSPKQNNPLKERVKEFYDELKMLQHLIVRAGNALNAVDEKTNLTKEIGILVRSLPNFKHLEHQANWFKSVIRKVCTGEIEPNVAYDMLEASYKQLVEVIQVFNEERLCTQIEAITKTVTVAETVPQDD